MAVSGSPCWGSVFIAVLTTVAALDTRQALRSWGVPPADLAGGTQISAGLIVLYVVTTIAFVGGVLAITRRDDA